MTSVPCMDPALQAALRLGLGLLFLSSSQHKIRDFARFRSAVLNYRVLPERWTPAVAGGLAAAEICVAIALLVPGVGLVSALAAAVLLAIYSGAIAINLFRGRRAIDCGCAGPGARRPLSEGLVARNAVLVSAAALCAFPVAGRPLVWIDAVTVAGGVAVLALLYGAIDGSLANAPRLRGLRGREWSTR